MSWLDVHVLRGPPVMHIPSDLVVDSCPHMLRAAQPLISRGYTTRGRKTSHKIKPTISRGCDFTTKSGGVWNFQGYPCAFPQRHGLDLLGFKHLMLNLFPT